jgi:hypothetical protein
MTPRRERRKHAVITLRVVLADTDPPVWRRLLLNTSDTFEDLHGAIQLAMGWEDYHLHEFRVGDLRIGIDDGEDDDSAETIDETTASLGDVLGAGARFAYEYDFGDSWIHDVEVEMLEEVAVELDYPVCVAGERACPPEDCGGISGYEEFLLVLSDPDHAHHSEFVRQAQGFDPTVFSLARANASLQNPR